MKELRKAATEKLKKAVEKSSRLSKKDDSGRPRLPKDVEGVGADIGSATLECLVVAVENLKPDNDNDGTSTMQRSKLRNDQDYRFITTNYFFKNYIDKTYSRYYEDDTDTVLTTQQDYAESIRVALIEEAITHIIKGYCMPSDLPWNQVDEVYVPINCNENFHWVLAVIFLKDWPNLETYKDKIIQTIQILNEHPFDVKYVQDNMQQECDNVDCGVFVACYAEYLSEEINLPSDGFEA
ncbi:hypothetical protein FXO38_31377 [Capsicum annuum]|uniref:Ubiquitin-like protease family profile domain-containing protein n=1 Tax=Capsicum annuum TaxID=4072 RepID=A0A2G3AN07_CAPAN|nr:hypothetical protein FXO38_31377 [Capsicum annuum]PHT95614.1 hypothetical protein T459_03496 [Capsicum annuum]